MFLGKQIYGIRLFVWEMSEFDIFAGSGESHWDNPSVAGVNWLGVDFHIDVDSEEAGLRLLNAFRVNADAEHTMPADGAGIGRLTAQIPIHRSPGFRPAMLS